MIEKKTPVLVLRYNSYRNCDFIEEHKNIITNSGSVWMVKLGKKIPESSLNTFQEAGGNLLLKSPKKAGDRFYYAHMSGFSNGKPKADYIYPEYYAKIIEESCEYTLDGTWIRIDELFEVKDEYIDHFHLIKNGSSLRAIINATRTSTLYVESDCDLGKEMSKDG